jgi:hypothetical protein
MSDREEMRRRLLARREADGVEEGDGFKVWRGMPLMAFARVVWACRDGELITPPPPDRERRLVWIVAKRKMAGQSK